MKFWALLWVLGCSGFAGTAWATSDTHNPLWPVVIGHRGLGEAHGFEPENSIVALIGAFNQRAGAVEFDVQLTVDGEVVLAHDPRLERMTNGSGCVAERTLSQLRLLRLKDGSGRIHADLSVSTLREALAAIRTFDRPDRPFLADIHIKIYDGLRGDFAGINNGGCENTDFSKLARSTLAIVEEAGLAGRVIFTSFDSRVLNLLKKSAPETAVGLLTLYRPKAAIKQARLGHYDFVALNHEHFTPADVSEAHASGVRVLVWSPRYAASVEWSLRTAHVDGVITDNVPVSVQVASQR